VTLLLIAYRIIGSCPLMNLLTRRLILALVLFAASNAARSAHAGLAEECIPEAGGGGAGAQGTPGTIPVTISVYARLADRTVYMKVYTFTGGVRGAQVGATQSWGVPAGYSFINTSATGLTSGVTYQIVTTMVDSTGTTVASGSTTAVSP
jgi:hypothetical protein